MGWAEGWSEGQTERWADPILWDPSDYCWESKNAVYVSRLTVRNDKYDTKGKDANIFLEKKCNDKILSFTDNANINSQMLNKSGLYLNKYEQEEVKQQNLFGQQF